MMGKGPLMPVTDHDRATEIYKAASILSAGFVILTAGHQGEKPCNVHSFIMLDSQRAPKDKGVLPDTYFWNKP